MITITPKAAEEIALSLHNPDAQGLLLRITIIEKDNEFHYALGLDERTNTDVHLQSSGIEYLVAYEQKDRLNGMVLDFDKIDEEQGYCFIFMNPNDPNYQTPDHPKAPKSSK